ncbi:hypothetical protein U0035_22845 [Niabella yanshanensis]|uniref:SPW repeat-containing integral membrane domain-containing protein n=1 Tax=Niabella yanshanensis TaxID=577386 RepID=A0ABZ0W943_9BACT|nr:hypothetical protein [Niabella yanshanensis]WQD38515.1 hypothetical protein U0035_22845 [Niabella yanshanensis]
MINTKLHGLLDYLVGVLLILAPRILGFDMPGSEQTFSMTMGVVIILYSLFTRYEWGLVRILPFKLHLLIDFLSGLLLLSSMWMLGTKSWFFFAVGALTIVVTTLSGRRRFPKL